MTSHERHGSPVLRRMKLATMVIAFVAASCGLAPHPAWSQAQRTQAQRTIKIVVPFAPGGGVDIVARLMADQIGRMQKVSVVVENRPGAGTLIGTEAVARAAPDGNTVLFAANSIIINPALRKTS